MTSRAAFFSAVSRLGAAALAALVVFGPPTARADDGDPRCADPAAACRGMLAAACLERFNAGAVAASTDCSAQQAAYRSCLSDVVERCGGLRTAPSPPDASRIEAGAPAAPWSRLLQVGWGTWGPRLSPGPDGSMWLAGAAEDPMSGRARPYLRRLGPDGALLDDFFFPQALCEIVNDFVPLGKAGFALVGAGTPPEGDKLDACVVFIGPDGAYRSSWRGTADRREAGYAAAGSSSDLFLVATRGAVSSPASEPLGDEDVQIYHLRAQRVVATARLDDPHWTRPYAAAAANDGGLWVAGHRRIGDPDSPNTERSVAWIGRLDRRARVLFQTEIEGALDGYNVALSSAPDGGVWALVDTREGAALLRYNRFGVVVVRRALDFGADATLFMSDLTPRSTGGFWLAGGVKRAGDERAEALLVAVAEDGVVGPSMTLGSPVSDGFNQVRVADDGAVWVRGQWSDDVGPGPGTPWLVRFGPDGAAPAKIP